MFASMMRMLPAAVAHSARRPRFSPWACQADGPAEDGVGDEQLLAVDEEVVAVGLGGGAQVGQVGAGPGLGQGEGRQPFAAGQLRQEAGLLLGVPKVRTGSTAPMQPCTDTSPPSTASWPACYLSRRLRRTGRVVAEAATDV
jgi:hypothetical protein